MDPDEKNKQLVIISTFFSALSTVSGRLMSKHKSTASESL